LNISSHFWDDEIAAQFTDLTKSACGVFSSVWVLWGGKLHRCHGHL